VRNPQDFLVVSLTLLFKPSTVPAETAPFDQNLDGGFGLGIGSSRFLVHERLVPL
jgi:hypothetical protein